MTQVQTLIGTATALQTEILARQFYESFNRRQFDTGERFVHPQAVFTYPPAGVQFIGRAGYRELVRRWVAAFPDSSLSIVHLRVTPGPMVQTEWVMHGTHSGTLSLPGFPPIAPTDIHMHLGMRETVCVANNMIVESVMEFDTEELRRQLAA